MSSAWRAELFWVVLLVLALAFLVRLSGNWFFATSVCALIYLFRHLFFINRLLHWLRGGKSGDLPQADGIWEEVFYLVFRVRRRNKRRKKQLLRMLDRFRTATAALPDATVVLGPRNEIDWFNDSASQFLGLRRPDVGQQIGNLVRNTRFVSYLSDENAGGTIAIPSPIDDTRELEVRVVPYGDEDFRLLVARDVTELKLAERVRSDFIANVSHELRTPITVMRGYIEALCDSDSALPERERMIFRRVEEQTNRMHELIESLLALTRLQSGTQRATPEPIDVAELLVGICQEAEVLFGFNPKLSTDIDPAWGVLGDANELRSAFSNLVINAMKYTPEDGAVTVIWRGDQHGARLEVSDTGPGIAPEHLPRLTERFYRVEVSGGRSRNGSGLGLAIAKHVLNRHEAALQVESVVGKGSRFICCFPGKRIVALPGHEAVRSSSDACDAPDDAATGEDPGSAEPIRA
ncbi:phosphate regulon sensor histidine kinase PhoR [Methylolobus aquaticus]